MNTAIAAPLVADNQGTIGQMIKIPRPKFVLMLMCLVLVCGLVLLFQQGPANGLPKGQQLSRAHRPPPPRDRWPWRAKHGPREAPNLQDQPHVDDEEKFQIPQPSSSLSKHINTHLIKKIQGSLGDSYHHQAKQAIISSKNPDDDDYKYHDNNYNYEYKKAINGQYGNDNDHYQGYNSNGGKEYNSDEQSEKELGHDDEYGEYGEVDSDAVPYMFNVTPPTASLLLYNRIPKCASSTMQTVLRRLSHKLNFEHTSSSIFDARQLDQDEQQDLVHNLTTMTNHHTLSYDRHIYYTNFTMFDAPAPVYVNMVRDPVERFISSFYYRRSAERVSRLQAKKAIQTPSDGWLNKTLEECVFQNDRECMFRPGDQKEMILTYFCGHHPFCTEIGNPQASAMARRTVKEAYSVVGLIEHMEVTLQLLEALVPRFMAGATGVYDHIRMQENRIVNKNSDKPKVTKKVKRELRRRLADDIDFYDFLEQHLFQQKKYFIDL